MFGFNKFSISRVAIPFATIIAMSISVILYFIFNGWRPNLIQKCIFLYVIFGLVRTVFIYKNEGGFFQLIKDLIIAFLGIALLMLIGVCVGWLANYFL